MNTRISLQKLLSIQLYFLISRPSKAPRYYYIPRISKMHNLIGIKYPTSLIALSTSNINRLLDSAQHNSLFPVIWTAEYFAHNNTTYRICLFLLQDSFLTTTYLHISSMSTLTVSSHSESYSVVSQSPETSRTRQSPTSLEASVFSSIAFLHTWGAFCLLRSFNIFVNDFTVQDPLINFSASQWLQLPQASLPFPFSFSAAQPQPASLSWLRICLFCSKILSSDILSSGHNLLTLQPPYLFTQP